MKHRSLLIWGFGVVGLAFAWTVSAVSGQPGSLASPAGAEGGVDEGHIVVFNMYYANAGMAEDVLETRLYASVVRARLGLPRGRVLKKIEGPDELPDVMWECEFADVAAHDRDMDARGASDAFEGVRDRMRTLIRRFERTLWRVVSPVGEPPTLTPAGLVPGARGPGGIVVTNWYYAEQGKRAEVLKHRVHASDVRQRLGYPMGRVLDRIVESTGELPEVLWQMDYGDLEARRKDAAAVSATAEFKQVMEKMENLVRDFDRALWEVQTPLDDDAEFSTP